MSARHPVIDQRSCICGGYSEVDTTVWLRNMGVKNRCTETFGLNTVVLVLMAEYGGRILLARRKMLGPRVQSLEQALNQNTLSCLGQNSLIQAKRLRRCTLLSKGGIWEWPVDDVGQNMKKLTSRLDCVSKYRTYLLASKVSSLPGSCSTYYFLTDLSLLFFSCLCGLCCEVVAIA